MFFVLCGSKERCSSESNSIGKSSNLPKFGLLFCVALKRNVFVGGTAVDTAAVVGDKMKLGIYYYNFFEHQFIFVSLQDWNVVYCSIRQEL